jgi:hypothetical protein
MRMSLAVALVLATAMPSLAQTQGGTATRVRGTVEKLDGQTLVVKSRGGQSIAIQLTPNASVAGVVAKSLADIREGDFVASTSMRGPDGTLRALEVHYLPQGVNQGQSSYDLAPDSIMTNAVVAGVSGAPDGRLLRVTFKGTPADILVPQEAPVVAFVPADMSLVKPGAAIVVNATKQPDETLTASRLTVEKDGVKPPM